MKTMEIYYGDLTVEKQLEFDNIFGPPGDFNHEIFSIFTYEVEDDDE